MADEITVDVLLLVENGTTPQQFRIEKANGSNTWDMSGDVYHAGVQNIGTSAENIVKGDVGTVGWCYFHNLD